MSSSASCFVVLNEAGMVYPSEYQGQAPKVGKVRQSGCYIYQFRVPVNPRISIMIVPYYLVRRKEDILMCPLSSSFA